MTFKSLLAIKGEFTGELNCLLIFITILPAVMDLAIW